MYTSLHIVNTLKLLYAFITINHKINLTKQQWLIASLHQKISSESVLFCQALASLDNWQWNQEQMFVVSNPIMGHLQLSAQPSGQICLPLTKRLVLFQFLEHLISFSCALTSLRHTQQRRNCLDFQNYTKRPLESGLGFLSPSCKRWKQRRWVSGVRCMPSFILNEDKLTFDEDSLATSMDDFHRSWFLVLCRRCPLSGKWNYSSDIGKEQQAVFSQVQPSRLRVWNSALAISKFTCLDKWAVSRFQARRNHFSRFWS